MSFRYPAVRFPVRSAAFFVSGCLVSGLVVASLASASTASQSITAMPAFSGSLVSGSTPVSVVDAAVDERFPSGTSQAVVVRSDSTQSLAEAAALASRMDAALVLATSSDDAAVFTRLGQLATTTVTLYGESTAFSTSFRSAITSSSRTIDHDIANDDPVQRSLAGLAINQPARVVAVGSEASAETLALASSTASGLDAGLLVLPPDPSLPSHSAAELHLESLPYARILEISIPGEIDRTLYSDSLEASPELIHIDAADLASATHAAASLAVQEGTSARTVHVAPSDQPMAIAAAGYLATGTGIVLLGGETSPFAGHEGTTANTWAKALSNELNEVVGIGVALPTDYADSVSVGSTIRAAAPAFRATSSSLAGTTLSVNLTAVSGASTYEAYDINGTLISTSATPVVSIADETSSLLILALDPVGNELANLELRRNSTSSTDQVASGVVSTSSSGVMHLVFTGSQENITVKEIRRTRVDPFAMEEASSELIAITCATTFTDANGDGTVQWDYSVTSVAVGSSACAASGSAAPAADFELYTARVSAPPFEWPEFEDAEAARSEGFAIKAAESTRAARPTVVDALMLNSLDASPGEERSSVASFPGDGWPDWRMRHQTYIPQKLIPTPIPSGNFLRPLRAFAGDDRGPSPNSSAYRTRADATYRFGADYGFTYHKNIGTTKRYRCGYGLLYLAIGECELDAQAAGSVNQITWTTNHTSYTHAMITLTMRARDPLQFLAPYIDVDISFFLIPGSSRVLGWHDNAPSHEIYAGPAESEWYPVYISESNSLHCLVGSIPGCTKIINTAM